MDKGAEISKLFLTSKYRLYILQGMEFEWDEKKNQANYKKHGLNFRDAEKVFAGQMIVRKDRRQDYGEPRFIAIGALEDIIVVTAYTVREDNLRIISMRKANRKERRQYVEKILF